jgi:predicted nuclease of predicted toxin-antitoxin system
MRILLDECLPRKLKAELPGHDVRTVPEMGWAGKTNGELLRLAAGRFDVFVTVDRDLSHQQNISAARVAVITLAAPSNRLEVLRPLMPLVQTALSRVQPGELLRIGAS